MHHEWGDEDFDWDALYKAERFIVIWMRRTTGMWIPIKEKYGTLRYGVPYRRRCWLRLQWERLAWHMFPVIIFIACTRWHHIAPEILCDLLPSRDKPLPWFARPFIKESPWISGG